MAEGEEEGGGAPPTQAADTAELGDVQAAMTGQGDVKETVGDAVPKVEDAQQKPNTSQDTTPADSLTDIPTAAIDAAAVDAPAVDMEAAPAPSRDDAATKQTATGVLESDRANPELPKDIKKEAAMDLANLGDNKSTPASFNADTPIADSIDALIGTSDKEPTPTAARGQAGEDVVKSADTGISDTNTSNNEIGKVELAPAVDTSIVTGPTAGGPGQAQEPIGAVLAGGRR